MYIYIYILYYLIYIILYYIFYIPRYFMVFPHAIHFILKSSRPRHRHGGNLLAPFQDAAFPEEAKLLDGFPWAVGADAR